MIRFAKHPGFSLIELVVVLAIVGIITTFAYSSYTDYLTRIRRCDGQSALLDLANRMELYYAEQKTYQTATIGTGEATDVRKNPHSPDNWYDLSITEKTASTFTLQATPKATQALNDKRCQSLTLNSFNEKGMTIGPNGTPNGNLTQCWTNSI